MPRLLTESEAASVLSVQTKTLEKLEGVRALARTSSGWVAPSTDRRGIPSNNFRRGFPSDNSSNSGQTTISLAGGLTVTLQAQSKALTRSGRTVSILSGGEDSTRSGTGVGAAKQVPILEYLAASRVARGSPVRADSESHSEMILTRRFRGRIAKHRVRLCNTRAV